MTKYNLPVEYDRLEWWERKEVREQYIYEQKGDCMHCKQSLAGDPTKEVLDKYVCWSIFPKDFLKHPIHLQHDHLTGLTEGAVHAVCNAVLWQYHGR